MNHFDIYWHWCLCGVCVCVFSTQSDGQIQILFHSGNLTNFETKINNNNSNQYQASIARKCWNGYDRQTWPWLNGYIIQYSLPNHWSNWPLAKNFWQILFQFSFGSIDFETHKHQASKPMKSSNFPIDWNKIFICPPKIKSPKKHPPQHTHQKEHTQIQ